MRGPHCIGLVAMLILPSAARGAAQAPPAFGGVGYHVDIQPEVNRLMTGLSAAHRPSQEAVARAIELRDADDVPGAEAECRKGLAAAVSKDGHIVVPEIHQLLGELLLRQGKKDEALQQFDRWVAERRRGLAGFPLFGRTSGEASVHLDQALAYCLRDNYQLALRHYTDPSVPASPRVYTPAGPVYPTAEVGTRTLPALKAAVLLQIALNPQSATLTAKEAARCLIEAAKAAPESPVVAYVCAQELRRQSRFAEAVTYYRLAARHADARLARSATDCADWLQNWLDHPEAHGTAVQRR